MPFLFSALMTLKEKKADIYVGLPSAWRSLLLSSTALKKNEKKISLDFMVSEGKQDLLI